MKMIRRFALALGAALLLSTYPVDAQSVRVVASCGSAGYTAGQTGRPLIIDANGNLCTAASVSASITGFAPASTGTPISVTTGGVTGTLPAGAVVVASNVGGTNNAYCKLGASATTSDQLISPNSWFAFTVGTATQLTCITSTSTTTVNMVGGTGLPTGAGGGGGGSGGGGAVTVADAADVAQGAVADAASTAGGTGTLSAKLRLMTTQLGTINTTLGTPMQATGGTVGLVAGTAVIGHVICDSGCSGSGGTASTFGAAFPATGTAIGLTNGTNMVAWSATSNYGTSPGAIAVPAVNANVTNTNANLVTNADGIAVVTAAGNAGAGSPVNSANYVFNGTTWDRMPGSTTGVTVKAASGGFAGGSMVDVGAQADSVCSTDTGTCTLIALTKRNNARLTTLNTSIGAANAYETVAASQTAQAMGATGATGDFLSHCVATPGTTSPGVVTILDNATAIVSFAGGASSVSNLVPFPIPIGAVSVSGAWKITTGANVTVVCFGRFT